MYQADVALNRLLKRVRGDQVGLGEKPELAAGASRFLLCSRLALYRGSLLGALPRAALEGLERLPDLRSAPDSPV
jgi:hypothetical protein